MNETSVRLEREFPGGIRYGAEELEAIRRVVEAQSPFRYYGPQCRFEARQFEEDFARYLDSQPGHPWPSTSPFLVTASNSGTGALEVALDALGTGCGDEVLTQGFFWISTISSVVRSRAVPVLVDSDDTMNMDPVDLERKITDRTRIVLLVHMAGEAARIGPIMDVVRRANRDRLGRGLPVIRVLEDCAQMIGGHTIGAPGSVTPLGPETTYRVGAFGDVGIFSLQLNKNITSGEGGVIVTRDPALHRRIQAINDVGFIRDSRGTGNVEDGDEQTLCWGQGRRFTELQGALARVQLGRLDEILSSMRTIHRRLEKHLAGRPGITTRPHADGANGDSGGFLLIHLPQTAGDDEQRFALGRKVAAGLKEGGLLAFYCHDYEVHVYYNIPQLRTRLPIHPSGCPWGCERNLASREVSYGRGTLPRLDELFSRTVGIVIPSRATEEQEASMARVVDEVLSAAGIG